MKAHASFGELFCSEKRPISWKLTSGVNEIIYRLYDYSKKGERRERERERLFSANCTHLTPLKPFSACPPNSNLILFFFHCWDACLQISTCTEVNNSDIKFTLWRFQPMGDLETKLFMCTCVTFSWASWCLLICVCLIFKVSLVIQNGWLQRVQLLACGVCFLLSSIFGQGGQRSQYPLYTFWSSPILTSQHPQNLQFN